MRCTKYRRVNPGSNLRGPDARQSLAVVEMISHGSDNIKSLIRGGSSEANVIDLPVYSFVSCVVHIIAIADQCSVPILASVGRTGYYLLMGLLCRTVLWMCA